MTAATPTRPKTDRDENFPVASFALSRAKRGPVLAFYRFVRAADDVADAALLPPAEKLARLDAMEQALVAGDAALPEAAALHAVAAHDGAGLAEARLLLDAFRQDAVKARYADWAELLGYCARSADPVGRFLLRLHGEDAAADAPADALCTALQILNHLQDLGPDRERLDRIYLPVPWLERAGGEAAFFAPENESPRRAVLDAALDRVDELIDAARALPGRLRDRRLAVQSAATIGLAERLSRRLRRDDPILTRVEVSKPDFARAFAGALLRRHRPDVAVTRRIVAGSGSSFRLGMQHLVRERRRGIHAVYAYCRVIDDIADGVAPAAEKLRFLDGWRREVDRLGGAPETPIGRELAWAKPRFDLDPGELHALLDGMTTDAADRLRIADDAELDRYSRHVAGSVGALSVRIFGAPEAHDFALALGRTLQIVNVLRDVDEDAALERVYVPRNRLAALGLDDCPAHALVVDPRFARACQDLAEEAAAGFARADDELTRLDRKTLKPAILMMEGYRRIFHRLQARGWAERNGRLRLKAIDRLQLLRLAMSPAT
jgi:hydroxysqualene synthase